MKDHPYQPYYKLFCKLPEILAVLAAVTTLLSVTIKLSFVISFGVALFIGLCAAALSGAITLFFTRIRISAMILLTDSSMASEEHLFCIEKMFASAQKSSGEKSAAPFRQILDDQKTKENDMVFIEKMKYALQFQTDDGMIAFLERLNDERIADILNGPKDMIRAKIKALVEEAEKGNADS